MTDAPGLRDRLAQLLLLARDRELSGGAVLTFAALLLHADVDGGIARPSVARLGEITGLDRRSVQRALEVLVEQGAIALADPGASRQASGGRGRITRYVVAPHAIRGDGAALCRRESDETAAAAPPIEAANSGVPAADLNENSGSGAADCQGNGGDGAAVIHGKGGTGGMKGRRPVHERAAPLPHEQGLNRVRTVPPQPPRGGAGAPAEDDDESAKQRRRTFALQRIERIGRLEHEFAVRAAIARFDADAGTLAELDALIAATDDGRRSRRDRIGLLTTWLANLGMWRGVLADAGERERTESAPRRAAASVTSPASARELLHLPAREGT